MKTKGAKVDVKNLPERLRKSADYLRGLSPIDFSCEWVTCRRAADEIERLRAIVDRLPITADGVSLVPLYDKCYAIINGIVEACFIQGCEYSRGWVARPCRQDIGYSIEIGRCYSTREAAEAAREE